MPLQSTLGYVRDLINGLAMPGGSNNLIAYITPPAVDDDPDWTPRAYVWPASFDESRNPTRGGTVPRALSKPVPGQSPNSGFKAIDHVIHVYVVWDQANDDEQSDSWFPGMIDAINWQLRVSADPAVITDVYDGTQTSLIDVGETINGQIAVRALDNQRTYRYDCLLMLPIVELIQS